MGLDFITAAAVSESPARLESRRNWLFYLLVISGFQRSGSFGFANRKIGGSIARAAR